MIFKDWDLGFENNFLLSSLLYAFVLSFRMQMNFGEDGMEFSDPSEIDIMHNIDVSKFMEEFMQGSGRNPMWRKNKREDIYHPLRLLVYWLDCETFLKKQKIKYQILNQTGVICVHNRDYCQGIPVDFWNSGNFWPNW